MLKYAAGADERDFALYRSCFVDDAQIVDFGPEPFDGADNWLAYVKKALSSYRSTQHMLGPTYALIDGDSAETRTDVQALHCPEDETEPNLILWATYKTHMVRRDNQWRIQRHQLVRREMRLDPK